jgi:hypothetical protein
LNFLFGQLISPEDLKGAHLMLPSEATDQGGLAEKTQGGAHSGARLGFVSA